MSKIYAYHTPEELIAHMERIARRTVKHYFSDFSEHDVNSVMDAKPGEVRHWIIRETGTWFPLADDVEFTAGILRSMPNVAAYRFIHGFYTWSLEKVDLSQLRREYEAADIERQNQEQLAAC